MNETAKRTIKKISDCQGWKKGGGKWTTEDFYSSEVILYETAMVDTHHYPFVQIHRMTAAMKLKDVCSLEGKLWQT